MRNAKGQFIKGYTKVLSEETKIKISNSCKERGIGKWMQGRKPSDQTKKKLSENSARYWLGKKRGPQSEETKQKRSLALKGRKLSADQIAKMKVHSWTKGKIGREHPRWKEVKKNPLYKSIRSTFKYREWRITIFTRDNFTCVLCRIKGGYLEVDHYPKMFIEIINEYEIKTLEKALECKELWDIKNGRTLCKKCHLSTPTWGRRGLRNKKNKWLNIRPYKILSNQDETPVMDNVLEAKAPVTTKREDA